MIYEYEAAILRYVNSLIPSITLMTYSKKQEVFNAMSKVTTYPAFFYYREVTDWVYNKALSVLSDSSGGTFVPFEQKYVGRILVKNFKDAQNVASALRFGWLKSPYLNLSFSEGLVRDLKVGLRLLYIKIDEDRPFDDTKGAMRFVEFEWMSQLYMSDEFTSALVEEVNIYYSLNNNIVTLYDGEKIILRLD